LYPGEGPIPKRGRENYTKVWLFAVGDRASQRGGEDLRNEFFPSWLAANQDAAVEYGKSGAKPASTCKRYLARSPIILSVCNKTNLGLETDL
jgi:hypothetical protein